MKFIDFFAGIGGIRLGLEMAGHKCIGYCEIDRYARQAYEAMYNTEGEWTAHDIRTVKSVPRADLWTFGFPCQDISLAGSQAGIERGGRSNLFFEIIRLLRGTEDKPKWLLCENVKNLLYINDGFDFARVCIELGDQGYDIEYEVLNSRDFGVPQHRQRVFIVGHYRGGRRQKIFPVSRADSEGMGELREQMETGRNITAKFIDLVEGGKITDIARAILARYTAGITAHKGENCGVLTRDKDGNPRIRRLTPRECWRLQGFPDEYYERARAAGLSNAQMYKQAGNTVTVTVAKAIGEKLKEVEE